MTDVTAPAPPGVPPIPPEDEEAQSLEEFLQTGDRPRWKRWAKYWVPALIVLALALGAYVLSQRQKGPDYMTQPVERGSLDLFVIATGNLRPTNQVEVGSEVSGRIDSVLVDVNDQVRREEILAVINTDVIDDQITQSRASVNSARAAVSQARATLEVDVAQLGRLREVSRLSDGRVPSETEMQAAEAAVARDRAALASAQANVTSAEAALSSSVTNRDRAVIRSPVSGVVLARRVEPGQTVAAAFNTPTLFVLAEDLSTMQLRVAIDEADVGQVKAGQRATFVVDAYPGRRFPAEVTRVDLASNNTATGTGSSQTGTTSQATSVVSYEARLAVSNPGGLLRPGMTATATIETANTGVRLLVPNSALRFNPDAQEEAEGGVLNPQVGLGRQEQQATIGVGSRQRVYVLEDGGTLRAVDVVTGETNGRITAVTSDGLRPGMPVVTGIRVPRT